VWGRHLAKAFCGRPNDVERSRHTRRRDFPLPQATQCDAATDALRWAGAGCAPLFFELEEILYMRQLTIHLLLALLSVGCSPSYSASGTTPTCVPSCQKPQICEPICMDGGTECVLDLGVRGFVAIDGGFANVCAGF
jgi:hypothetical protein